MLLGAAASMYARLLQRQAHCTCEIDLGSLRRRVFATHIRVGLISCSDDNAEKVKGRMKGGAAEQGRSEEFLSADGPLLILLPFSVLIVILHFPKY